MKDERIFALDQTSRLSVVATDCTDAAVSLARGHLSGPVAASCLSQALAGVALLGAECSRDDETVTFRLDCIGPLEGFLVEATEAGTLRGYTKIKLLPDFDGVVRPNDIQLFGETGTFEVIRSVPGAILGSGTVAVKIEKKNAVAAGLDAFFAQSLQRRVRTALASACADDGTPLFARGVMVECPPDGDESAFREVCDVFSRGDAAKALTQGSAGIRNLLGKIGMPHAEIRENKPIAFVCRCSAERAAAMLAAIPKEERAALPPALDVTCHMCGRTWTVRTGN